jgi:hypothetical protein
VNEVLVEQDLHAAMIGKAIPMMEQEGARGVETGIVKPADAGIPST